MADFADEEPEFPEGMVSSRSFQKAQQKGLGSW